MFRFRHFAAPAVLGAALFVSGCTHDRHEEIPLSATEMLEGKEQVVFNAPYDGRVYVYDATRNEMIYNGELRRGQTIKVDTKKDKVLVDNQTAVEKDLLNDHRYKIFFDKDENAAAARENVPSQTTIVTPPGARTSVTTDPNSPRTTITTDPNRSSGQTTVETTPGTGGTRVTTPDATITTDPNSQRTTVQPR
ncbi:MAG: hypothetical protein QOF78_132 [Phycisphaerales bacterium]|jgi:hypothetical protein|nr:hypothetical protein [Phycisphaerales bacterium]